ncbi:hypothetical protein ACFO0N_02950 [Halobium salinum]|uniref:DUF1616 domain-containing protein n=1 Tax=Halobium salinum TaxID=1364940 RepID=A0ABD5P7M9_9EURY|nr:hypothetical protein [Halobium salinum]
MDYSDASVATVLAFLAVVTVATGPLLPAVGLSAGSAHPVGSGDAAVTLERPPVDGLELVRGDFDAGTYHLESTPGRVAVDDVSGNPALKLTVDVPGIYYSDVRTYELGGRSGESVRLRFPAVDVSPEYVTANRYDATVGVWLRTGDEYDQLYQETVTVEVRR